MDITKKPINKIKLKTVNDYLDPEKSEGMPALVDSTIALDFLLTAKNGITNCAIALTEIADPDTRAVLRGQLNTAINLHTEIADLMMAKGWFHPYQVNEQFRLDRFSSETAADIARLDLFPGDTSRLGTFATPNY